MKVCLYLEFKNLNKQASGLGVALAHQKIALEKVGISYTENPKDEYDILHTNFMGPRTYFLVKKAKKQGKKVVAHIHTTPEDFANSFAGSGWIGSAAVPFFKKYARVADQIIVPSEYTKDLLIKKYGIKTPIKALSNGMEIQNHPYLQEDIKRFKKKYKIKEKFVFSIGLVFARKGIDDFIKVGRELKNVSFLWAGRRFSKWFTTKKNIQNMLEKLPENVEFPGYIDDKWLALAAADVFLFPSREENQGIVVLEAATMKKAIIVRDIPVYHTYLRSGINCLMAKNTQEFKELTKKVLQDDALRKRLGENAYRMVQKHDLAVIGQELKQLYTKLLA